MNAGGPDPSTVVWLASPERMPAGLSARWLARDERARLARFTVASAARTFAASRVLLRLVADRYGTEPTWSQTGAPRFVNVPRLAVSASGTRGLVAVAVTRGPRIGVDVERIRARPVTGPLPGAVLAPAELALLQRHDAGERAGLFCRLWARKEALLKARGRGLAMPGADVSWCGDAGRVHLPEGVIDVHDLDCDPRFAAAVAAERIDSLAVHGDGWSTVSG